MATHHGEAPPVGGAKGSAPCLDARAGDTGNAVVSQAFSDPGYDIYDSAAAQVFTLAAKCTVGVVRVAGQYFNGAGPADSETVTIYQAVGGRPTKVISRQTVRGMDNGTGSFMIPITKVVLKPKVAYAVSVQVNMSFAEGGEWGWEAAHTGKSDGVWENPGDGFGTGCTSWEPLQQCMEGDGLIVVLAPPEVLECGVLAAGFMVVRGCYYDEGNGVYDFPQAAMVNGVTYTTPHAGLVLNLPAQTFHAFYATVTVQTGPSTTTELYNGGLDLNFSSGSYTLPLSTPQPIAGLAWAQSVFPGHLVLSVPQSGYSAASFDFTLPALLGGGSASGSLQVDSSGNFTASLTATDFSLGSIDVTVKNLDLSYSGASAQWNGTLEFTLPGAEASLTLTGAASTAGGVFSMQSFSISAQNLNIPLGPSGAILKGASLSLTWPPNAVLSGTVTIVDGPGEAATISGAISYDFTTHTLTMSGSLAILDRSLTSAQVIITPSSFTANGTFDASRGCLGVSASVGGFFDANGFQLTGSATAHICIVSLGADVVVSSNGAAACAHWSGLFNEHYAGAGWHWGGGLHTWTDDCNMSSYSYPRPGRGVRSTDSTTVPVSSGLTDVAFTITGDTGIPDATVTGPGGESIETTQTGVSPDGHYLVSQDASTNTAYVLVANPTGGQWSVNRISGAQITQVGHAESLPDPQVAATVSPGSGNSMVLDWNLKPLPDQVVTFVERGSKGTKTLTSTNDASGEYVFTPGDGVGERRTIEADVYNGASLRTSIDVTTYQASALATLTTGTTSQNGGSGTVTSGSGDISCGAGRSACTAAEAVGSSVTLTASPAAGSTFIGWTGLCTGLGTCQLAMNEASSATAVFATNTPAVAPVIKLAATQRHTAFKVSWKSKDKLAATYDVQYIAEAVGGSAYTDPVTWLQGTSATSGSFQGGPAYSYCFIARETNSAGNTSAWSAPVCTTTP